MEREEVPHYRTMLHCQAWLLSMRIYIQKSSIAEEYCYTNGIHYRVQEYSRVYTKSVGTGVHSLIKRMLYLVFL